MSERIGQVVILGGNGFIGRNLAAALTDRGIQCMAISSKIVDLVHPESVSQLRRLFAPEDVLVIAAALTPDRGRDRMTFMQNIQMIHHVCDIFDTTSCAHVIYISSDAVYPLDGAPKTEGSFYLPQGFHGMMHLARETMLRQAVGDIPLLIVRPCAVYGVGDPHNSYGPNRFIRSACTERTIKLFGEGEECRDYIFIGDLTRLLVSAIVDRVTGTVNVASGESISFMTLAKLVQYAFKAQFSIDVTIECTARQTPVTHSAFNTARLGAMFPSFHVIPHAEGINAVVAESFRDTSGSGG